jgi:hypothetical protein
MKIKILFFIDTLNGGGAEKVLRNLVNSMDYDSSRIGEFAKSVLSPEVLEEISKKAEKYHTPTWREKYGWDSTKTIDF